MVAARGDGTEAVPLEEVAGRRKTVPLDHPWVADGPPRRDLPRRLTGRNRSGPRCRADRRRRAAERGPAAGGPQRGSRAAMGPRRGPVLGVPGPASAGERAEVHVKRTLCPVLTRRRVASPATEPSPARSSVGSALARARPPPSTGLQSAHQGTEHVGDRSSVDFTCTPAASGPPPLGGRRRWRCRCHMRANRPLTRRSAGLDCGAVRRESPGYEERA